MNVTQQQINTFVKDGYLVIRNLLDASEVQHLQSITQKHLLDRVKPFELEADVHYPGAPSSVDAEGGETIRRLHNAYDRHAVYKEVAENPAIIQSVKTLLKSQDVYLNPNHHNCIMTKSPEYSSKTNWHRDTRYWNFDNKYLINAWLALGEEKEENGGMLILPGSHRWDVQNQHLDEAQFLKENEAANKTRLSLAEHVDLQAGDCLLFSAHCFHAAGSNQTQSNKYSLVFTYHGESTKPLSNSRSDLQSAIKITSL